jgi:Peptidase family S41
MRGDEVYACSLLSPLRFPLLISCCPSVCFSPLLLLHFSLTLLFLLIHSSLALLFISHQTYCCIMLCCVLFYIFYLFTSNNIHITTHITFPIPLSNSTQHSSNKTRHNLHRTTRGGDRDDLKALVIDMRNNGGGLLQGAVETANLLLPPGQTLDPTNSRLHQFILFFF